MKALLNITCFALVLSLVFACNNAPEGQSAQVGDASSTTAQASASAKAYTATGNITWTGSKKIGGQHQGTIRIGEGTIYADNTNIEKGQFSLDMNSINVIDLKAGEGKEDLEGHLKTGDFFETEKFPSGQFVITKVEPASGQPNVTHNITGNLTLKGVTKSVTFPANVIAAGNKISAVTPAFKINRTEWGIKYGSGLIGTPADKIIHDEIALVVNLQATERDVQ